MTLIIGHAKSAVICRACGCDDNHACVDARGRPCSWVLLDLDAPTGVCSACANRMHWHPIGLAAMGRAGEISDYVCAGLEHYLDDFSEAAA